MLMDMALNKQRILFRVQTTGNVLCQLLQGPAAQVSRILPHGNGVQVSHEVIAVIVICPFCPVFDGPEVGAQS